MKALIARLILASLAVVLLDVMAELVFAAETGQQLAYVSTGGTVGEYPVVISPDGSSLYVTGDQPVAVLDMSTNSFQPPIEIPGCNTSSACLSVINTVNHDVEAVIPIRIRPLGMAITPNGTSVYVTDYWDNSVYVIDTTTNMLLTKIEEVAFSQTQVVISPDGKIAYVASFNGGDITVIDVATNTVSYKISNDEIYFTGLAITPDGTRIYATTNGNFIAVIDTSSNSIVDRINIGEQMGCRSIAITPDGMYAYAATILFENGKGPVAIIETLTNTIIGQISNIDNPGRIFITPDGIRLYVTSAGNGLWVFDTQTNTEIAILNASAWGTIAFAPSCPVKEMIEALIQHVQTIDLKNSEGFTAKLDKAQNSYSEAVANDYVNTINQLEAFKNKCDADSRLSANDRNVLKSEADLIINCVRSKI